MGRAFTTGAEPLDWLFLTRMLYAQGDSELSNLITVASSVSPCVINIVNGEYFGGYSVVICEYPASGNNPAFNYVSILGTNAKGEVIADILGAPLVPAPWLNEPFRGDVVSFFYINAMFLSTAVRSVLKNENPTIFAGHSLGGASCQIMAASLAALGYPVLGCYTIGSPKPGSQPFADSLTFPVFNLEAVGDIIPSLPQIIKLPGLPWWLGFVAKKVGNSVIWAQTGTLLTLGNDGSIGQGGQQYGQLQIIALLDEFNLFKHYLVNYLDLLSIGHPQPKELRPCASGYAKPWRIFLYDDPVFPPQPPAQLAPCVSGSWNNNDFVYLVDYSGHPTLLDTLPDPPPTFPLPPLPNGSAANQCCKFKSP